MSRPRQNKSVDAQSGTGAGSSLQVGGRVTVHLFVVARNLDTGNDTLKVDLEVSMDDGSNWAKLRDDQGNKVGNVAVSNSDFNDPESDGTFAAHVNVHGVSVDQLRANVTSFTDSGGSDLEVDAYVGATANSDVGKGYRTV